MHEIKSWKIYSYIHTKDAPSFSYEMKNTLGVPYDTKNMLRWLSNVISVFSWTVDIIDYTAFQIFGNLVFLYL